MAENNISPGRPATPRKSPVKSSNGTMLKVKILAKSDVRTYTKDDGNEGKVLVLGVSDGEKCYKLQSYDTTTYSRLALYNVVLMKNYIDKGTKLVVTKQSKVFVSGGLTVSEDHCQTCRDIVSPPPAPIQKIDLALGSPHKTRTSIKGQFVKEEQVQNIMVRGKETPITEIVVEDETGQAKVTLWRDMTNIQAKCTGQPVLILHTNIIAIINDEDVCRLLNDDGIEYTCPAALGNNPQIELQSLTKDGPVRVQISVKGREVKNIVVYQD